MQVGDKIFKVYDGAKPELHESVIEYISDKQIRVKEGKGAWGWTRHFRTTGRHLLTDVYDTPKDAWLAYEEKMLKQAQQHEQSADYCRARANIAHENAQ